MSYRLINANAIAESFQEVNDMPCIYADLSDGLDGRLYDLRETGELQAENAKLRELCKDIWNDALRFDEFWDYVHDDGTIYREDELPHYQERMRECGIEVK